MSNAISALWSAKSVAVIGATERAGAMGRLPMEYLKKYGFAGAIYPVNPKGGNILGMPAYKSISEVKVEIELALIMLPADQVRSAVQECADAKVAVAIVMSSGFAEAGEAGEIAQNELIKIAKISGMRLVGPNCIGSVGGQSKLTATFSPVFSSPDTPLDDGNIALVSQSGALGYGIYSLAVDRSLPIGVVVTTGNEADLTALEVAEALTQDEKIDAILIYVESLTNLKLLEKISKTKPTAILKSGRSAAGAQAAASHTGALATEDLVIDAAIKKSGAIRVDDVEHLLDAASIFAAKKTMKGNRVAILTTSGGSGILGTDALEKFGLTLAKLSQVTRDQLDQIVPSYGNTANPVDVTAAVMSEPQLFERCVEVLAKDLEVDAIVATFCVLVGSDVERIANALSSVKNIRDIPVVVARTGSQSLAPEADKIFKSAALPVFPTPERAVRSLEILRVVSTPPIVVDRKPLCNPITAPMIGATENQLKSAFGSVGVPVPVSTVIESSGEAIAAVTKVGGRAVMKAVIPGLLHKSEAGGVALDITILDAVETFERLSQLISGEKSNQVLVETFIPKGVEALVGITSSPLGKVLTVGVGGILTEIISDVSVRLLPVDSKVVNQMIDETRLGALLSGVRGAAPAARDTFVDTVLRITDAVIDWPSGSELDINPLTVLPDGVWVLDCAYSLAEQIPDRSAK